MNCSGLPIDLNDLGLRSTLRDYQKRSVSTMFSREQQRGSLILDPCYVVISSISSSKQFYLQPATLELVRERPEIVAPSGGILCEEPGLRSFLHWIFWLTLYYRNWEDTHMPCINTRYSQRSILPVAEWEEGRSLGINSFKSQTLPYARVPRGPRVDIRKGKWKGKGKMCKSKDPSTLPSSAR